eukprot:Lithocolla_globosa_v1_NODE_2870_length_1840_cov_101.379832.p3 type:complete len:122 gc:universal NODE_2870_length_1840_cov_101.379832:667-1032(+)
MMSASDISPVVCRNCITSPTPASISSCGLTIWYNSSAPTATSTRSIVRMLCNVKEMDSIVKLMGSVLTRKSMPLRTWMPDSSSVGFESEVEVALINWNGCTMTILTVSQATTDFAKLDLPW